MTSHAPHAGSGHFLQQRATALLNLPLGLFTFWTLWNYGGSAQEAAAFIGQVPVAVLMLAFIDNALWHMRLGIESVLEDYITGLRLRVLLKAGNYLVMFGGMFVAAAALLMLVLRQAG